MISQETLQTRLENIVGRDGVGLEDAPTTAFAIDTQTPAAVVRPQTVEQAAEVVTLAGRERLAVVPWGQGTQMHLGNAPQRYDLALSLADLNRIVEYDQANLTVIAEAGVPLREIYKVSVPEGQFLPLGFPGTRASLGGLLVTNTSGVKRTRYGGLRDLLLGVRAVLPDGSLVRFGGRVVKNVAGYDMNKLFIGSLGAFGVILETTYRLAALPEEDRLLAVAFPTLSQAAATAAAVQASQLQPSALTLLSAEAVSGCAAVRTLPAEAGQVALLLNFDGTHEALERQFRDSQALCQRHGGRTETVLTGEELLTVWEFQEAWRAVPDATQPPRLHVRLGVLPSHLADTVRYLTAMQETSQAGLRWLADYSSGQIFAQVPLDGSEGENQDEVWQGWLQQVRTHLRDWHGYCVVEYAPPNLRRCLDVWGDTPAVQLLRLYKQRFDPEAILNPGRYVAGL
jgi:glycolate oxidase FAD binding subunit